MINSFIGNSKSICIHIDIKLLFRYLRILKFVRYEKIMCLDCIGSIIDNKLQCST